MKLVILDFYGYKTGKAIIHEEEVESDIVANLKFEEWLTKLENPRMAYAYSMATAEEMANEMLLVTPIVFYNRAKLYANKTEDQWIDEEIERKPSYYAPEGKSKADKIVAIKGRFYFSTIRL